MLTWWPRNDQNEGTRPMKSRLVIVHTVCILCVFAGQTGSAQTINQDSLPGCYELKVGPWTPPLGTPQFSTPPDTIQLLADSSYERPRPGWKRASPPIRHAHSRGRERVLWTVLDPLSFRVVWSDGFTGADLRLF